MRFNEFINENSSGSLSNGVGEAMPATYAMTGLTNQDPYLQYRFGLALAAARAKKEGTIPYEEESKFGENLVVVARSKEEEETLAMALALFGKDNASRLISTSKSEEAKDVYTKSPIQAAAKKTRARNT